jgi:DNA-3-methyladenine glycosylase II
MWQEAERFLSKDKHIGPLIKKWGRCTIKKTPKHKYFESLVETICSQQLSIKVARTIFERVRNLVAKQLTPDQVLKISDQYLRACGLSWQKVLYIKDLASKTASGELRVTSLDKMSDEEVILELVKVKGIGKWSAEMILMFDLGRTDILPKDDLGINKALKRLKIKEKDTEKWRPYRTIASWYLWKSLENF